MILRRGRRALPALTAYLFIIRTRRKSPPRVYFEWAGVRGPRRAISDTGGCAGLAPEGFPSPPPADRRGRARPPARRCRVSRTLVRARSRGIETVPPFASSIRSRRTSRTI
ncbi:hypothetical protein EVAR_39218_1 [Eumeta japonica]|uniref:Uncharacterized protein n=1 Tax=Eumeta variegata TaxID=151549 RepID=A0A4C1VN90_EUMVA|nr:hypothetical protein EVAR_39218_1 [Eumeta japonica]